MVKITVDLIIKICNGILLTDEKNLEINSFSNDTRNIKKGNLYLGIKGENSDGNDYIEQAFENGAIGAIVDREIDDDIINKYKNKKIIIKVENTIKAIQELAKYKREKAGIPVVAVTGSVGKTSTKDMIASVLSEQFKVLKTEGNYNNHIGLPLTLLRLQDEEIAVIEMGMNHFGEIRTLTNIAKPNVCVITNVGTAHIGNLGSRENILKSKLEMLEGMQENGTVVINNDNDLLNLWNKKENLNNVITFGIDTESTYNATEIKCYENHSEFKLNKKGIKVPVAGMHFIYNTLCAYSVGKIFNMLDEEIIDGIANLKLTAKRMDIKEIKNEVTVINDSYNASFDSVKALLEVLKNYNGKRKIAILGDILELGDFSEEIHKKIGFEINKNNIDILITVGKYAQLIVENVDKNITKTITCENNQEAIKFLNEIIKYGDVILLKASNGMNFGEILDGIER